MPTYLIFDLININDKYSRHQIGIKLGIEHIIYEKWANFMYKKDIHVNKLEKALVCKCVFCTTKRNAKGGLNFEGLEMQKQNIPTDRA